MHCKTEQIVIKMKNKIKMFWPCFIPLLGFLYSMYLIWKEVLHSERELEVFFGTSIYQGVWIGLVIAKLMNLL